ncbi:MAG: TolC family protein, partial [Bacteroidota bacterium]
MFYIKNIACSLACLLLVGGLAAQSPMTLEAAIRMALENNHQIRIQKIELEKSTKQVDPSLVGKKPTINLNASYEFGWSDANIETLNFNPGAEGNSELELDGISNDLIISPELNLLLLDGGASNYRLEQLGMVNNINQIQLKQRIEQTVAEVTAAFLEVNRQKSLLDIAQKNMDFTQNRLDRIKIDQNYGTSGSLQQLQVEVDLKTDSAQLRSLIVQFDNARRNLNYLLGQDSEEQFILTDNFPIEDNVVLEQLESELMKKNTLLQMGNRNIQLADIDLKLSKAAFKPSVQAYANFTYAY